MRVGNFSELFQGGAVTQRAPSMERIVSMMNEEGRSSLAAAQQALLDAKAKLDQQRDEDLEAALPGYKALCARQRSYEEQLGVQQEQLENFQALSSRYDALSEELAKVRGEAASASEEGSLTLDLSRRVTALEQQAAAADQDISSLVEQMNRYTNGQKQYADYLEKTGQSGYAAFQYREQPEYTRENFVAETTAMVQRLEAGTKQCRERVSAYCEECGFSAYDFESYMQERNRLRDACLAAEQRLSELLRTQDGAQPDQDKPGAASPAPARDRFDAVEISKDIPVHKRTGKG